MLYFRDCHHFNEYLSESARQWSRLSQVPGIRIVANMLAIIGIPFCAAATPTLHREKRRLPICCAHVIDEQVPLPPFLWLRLPHFPGTRLYLASRLEIICLSFCHIFNEAFIIGKAIGIKINRSKRLQPVAKGFAEGIAFIVIPSANPLVSN